MLPPLTPPPATERTQPSLGYAAIALGFLLAGLAIAGFLFYKDTKAVANSMSRSAIPNPMQLQLHKDVEYTIFLELPSSGRPLYPRQPTVECQVNSMPYASPVSLSAPATRFSYQLPNVHGYSVYEFQVPSDGDYLVGCTNVRDWSGEAIAAIGSRVVENFSTILLRSFLIGGASVVIALLIFTRVLILRDQSRREIRARGLKPI